MYKLECVRSDANLCINKICMHFFQCIHNYFVLRMRGAKKFFILLCILFLREKNSIYIEHKFFLHTHRFYSIFCCMTRSYEL